MQIPKCLTIAGSDSGGGAGIQADLKTFAALGVHGSSAIVAITAQNTKTVTAVHNIPLDIIEKQIDVIFDDIGADAIKIGKLSNAPIILLVSKLLKKYNAKNIVLDPVMVSASGSKLLEDSAVYSLKLELIPMATIVTPNVMEAEILSGMKIKDKNDIETAARKILELGCRSVLMKGGHLPTNDQVTDYLFLKSEQNDSANNAIGTIKLIEIKHKKIMKEGHGTGCTLSSAIAANLAKGLSLDDSVKKATDYVHGALENGYKVGSNNFVLKHV